MNLVFMLLALAAPKMLRHREKWRSRAVAKPAIHSEYSKGQGSNSQTADKLFFRRKCPNVRFGAPFNSRLFRALQDIDVSRITVPIDLSNC